jgi:undecaprenyl-diphosphatase
VLEVFRAIVLGLVQGLTEFIPISSSGHMVLVPFLLRWPEPSLAFNVAMHFGTFGAVVLYFRIELLATVRGLLGLDRTPDGLLYRRLGILLLLATVPVAVVGFALQDSIERVFASPVAAALLLLVTAGLLLLAERVRDDRAARGASIRAAAGRGPGADQGQAATPPREGVPIEDVRLPTGADPSDPLGLTLRGVRWQQALQVGVFQCLALLPGISRSGATITAGMLGGLTREAATRFSFLLSLPALIGAAVLSARDLAEPGAFSGPAIMAGVVASFIAGYLAIRFLVALVARDRLTVFARYCMVASAVGLLGAYLLG